MYNLFLLKLKIKYYSILIKQKYYLLIYYLFSLKVFKRRVSIYEWLRDHDKLNSGRLLKETFKRAIDLCKLDLQPSEIELIIN